MEVTGTYSTVAIYNFRKYDETALYSRRPYNFIGQLVLRLQRHQWASSVHENID